MYVICRLGGPFSKTCDQVLENAAQGWNSFSSSIIRRSRKKYIVSGQQGPFLKKDDNYLVSGTRVSSCTAAQNSFQEWCDQHDSTYYQELQPGKQQSKFLGIKFDGKCNRLSTTGYKLNWVLSALTTQHVFEAEAKRKTKTSCKTNKQIDTRQYDNLVNKTRVWEYDDFTDYFVICLCYFAKQQVDSFSKQNNCIGKKRILCQGHRGSYMNNLRTHLLNTTKWQTLMLVHALNRCVTVNHVNRTFEGLKEMKAHVLASKLKNSWI